MKDVKYDAFFSNVSFLPLSLKLSAAILTELS